MHSGCTFAKQKSLTRLKVFVCTDLSSVTNSYLTSRSVVNSLNAAGPERSVETRRVMVESQEEKVIAKRESVWAEARIDKER